MILLNKRKYWNDEVINIFSAGQKIIRSFIMKALKVHGRSANIQTTLLLVVLTVKTKLITSFMPFMTKMKNP